MRDTILYDSAMRLFCDHVSPQVLAAAEAGLWPAELWDAVVEAGYLDVLAEGPAGMVEAATILRAAGHHAAPIPLAETMLARWLCAAAGIEAPDGPLSVALPESGAVEPVAWGRVAKAIAVLSGAGLSLVPGERARFDPGANLAGEPRDILTAGEAPASVRLPNSVGTSPVFGLGAEMRAAQMAGAMEAALDLSTRYANDRVQFGRPIGKFQAVQMMLAEAAGHYAAATAAADLAAEAWGTDAFGFAVAVAKARTGEAAGKVAEICHQVHGAMGFTQEHPLHFATRRLWSWRDEFGNEPFWQERIGRLVCANGGDALWPMLTGD